MGQWFWKIQTCFKNYIKILDYTLLIPIEQCPHVPMTETADGPTPKPTTAYGDNDRKMYSDDHKAYGVLSVCLSHEIAQTLRDYTTAKKAFGMPWLVSLKEMSRWETVGKAC